MDDSEKSLLELRNKAWAASKVSDSDELKEFVETFGEIWARRFGGYHFGTEAVPRSRDR
jgi:hypothetical protein